MLILLFRDWYSDGYCIVFAIILKIYFSYNWANYFFAEHCLNPELTGSTSGQPVWRPGQQGWRRSHLRVLESHASAFARPGKLQTSKISTFLFNTLWFRAEIHQVLSSLHRRIFIQWSIFLPHHSGALPVLILSLIT